jgi:hypothetical protein
VAERLEAEHANLRAALQWSLGCDQAAIAPRSPPRADDLEFTPP